MQRLTHKKQNIMLRAAGVLFALVLVTTWMTTGLLARYVVTAAGADEARVAAFVFQVKGKQTTQTIQIALGDITVPDTTKTYVFDVTNTRNSKTSEVAQAYSITMTLDGSLPLNCKLERNSESTNKTAAVQSVDALNSTMPVSTAPITGTFAAAEESTDTYTLTVNWPPNAKDPMYAYGAAMIELTVASEQIN